MEEGTFSKAASNCPFDQDAEPARRRGGDYGVNLCENRFVDSVGRETGVRPLKTVEIVANPARFGNDAER
jgi:hypothetical protein